MTTIKPIGMMGGLTRAPKPHGQRPMRCRPLADPSLAEQEALWPIRALAA